MSGQAIKTLRLFVLACLGLVSLISTSAFAQNRCNDTFTNKKERVEQLLNRTNGAGSPMIEKLNALIGEITSIPADIAAGVNRPQWQHFEKLEIILKMINDIKTEDRDDSSAITELKTLAAELRKNVSIAKFADQLETARKQPTVTGTYQASEYEIKLAYQFYLGRINRELPSELKIPLRRLALDVRRQKINREGEALVNHLTKDFDRLISTLGYADYAAFETHIRASTDPLVQKAIQLIDKDQIEVVMRRPENGRFWIPKTGFQNQHVTGSSKGALNNEWRNTAESQMYGVNNVAEYSLKDPEVKPKYGTLKTKDDSGVKNNLSPSYHYGPDLYTFKTKSIENRLTVFPTDSLNTGMWGTDTPNISLNQIFIPWSRRLLIVPLMTNYLERNSFQMGVFNPNFNTLVEYGPRSSIYWESQITGRLSLKDVSEFEFERSEPTGDFLKELQHHQIKIFRKIGGQRVTWPGTTP